MPDGALHACTRPGCKRLLAAGERCPDHSKPWAWRDPTKTTTERGYGHDWPKRRARILDRDQHHCLPCLRRGVSRRAFHVDHIVPKSQGGSDDDTNLQSVCPQCHLAKSAAERRRG